MGQLSSAILEYETILQRAPDDPEVQAALREIESKAGNFPAQTRVLEPAVLGSSRQGRIRGAPGGKGSAQGRADGN